PPRPLVVKAGCTSPEIVLKSAGQRDCSHGRSRECTTMPAVGDKVFCFEGYTLDVGRGSLRTGDRAVELRPKSFELLRYLLENAGRLASKEELIKAVWPNVSVTDESVVRCISDVRQALGDTDQRMIKTVLKRGYMFVAPIRRPDANGASAQAHSSTPSADT